jgi:putative PEP-CTERM system histidine kinase
MAFTASVLTHAAALVAYTAFAILLIFRGARTWLTAWLALAAVLTAAWAATVVSLEWSLIPEWVPGVARSFRDAAWFTLVLAVLYSAGQSQRVWRGLVLTTAGVLCLDFWLNLTGGKAGVFLGITLDSRASGFAATIIGLILVENMMRNMSRDQFWAIKLLGIGLFAVLGYELCVQLPQFLTNTPEAALATALPLVFVIVLPLFVVTAVRNPVSALRIHSSRQIIFHTTTLICIGVLLQGAAAAAFYVRHFGGDNATVLSIVIGFSSLVAFAVAITSGSVRSRLKIFITENFFSYKFDYRLEWNKFIRALSAWEEGDMPLRVLRTLAELLDSTGGALWVLRERWHQYMPVAHWSLRTELAPVQLDDPCLTAFQARDCAYIELAAAKADASAMLWRERFPAAWLVVPLRYRGALVGFALVNKPRVDRKLDWEDKNLISLVALQLAAYLVQEETVQALADARQLEEFNKRFAFIIHDTKNTIGQLSLLVRNAEQFGHDKEFQKDMVVTLRHSVEKLQGLLAQLRGDPVPKPATVWSGESVDIVELVSSFVRDKRKLGLPLVMSDCAHAIFARLPEQGAFLNVLDHVVTNAIEAAPKGSPVNIGVGILDGSIRVVVADSGPGMTQEFIADQLFRPLRTTKGQGFGIGAYQAREVMHDLGGNIDVRSKIGEGTSVALLLPLFYSDKEVARA